MWLCWESLVAQTSSFTCCTRTHAHWATLLRIGVCSRHYGDGFIRHVYSCCWPGLCNHCLTRKRVTQHFHGINMGLSWKSCWTSPTNLKPQWFIESSNPDLTPSMEFPFALTCLLIPILWHFSVEIDEPQDLSKHIFVTNKINSFGA